MLRALIYGFLCLSLVSQSAFADNFKAAVKQAEELSKAGAHKAALAAMDRATTAIWLRAPLTISKAFLVSKPATGFGEYQKRPSNIFPKDSTLRVYTELTGYDWQEVNGSYKINVTVDASLKNAKGKVIWSKKQFGHFQPSKPSKFKNLYVNLRLGMKTVPTGKYEIEYKMIDKIRNQTATVALPFEIQ